MKGYRKVRGMHRVIQQLAPLAKPGTVTIAEVRHDDTCPAWRTQRSADCTCSPNVVLRPVAAPKKGGQA